MRPATGDRSCIENFRPVALIPNFAKVFESIVAKNLQSHIRNCIHDSQHGFVQNKSTATNLCQFVQYVSTALHNKQQIDIVLWPKVGQWQLRALRGFFGAEGVGSDFKKWAPGSYCHELVVACPAAGTSAQFLLVGGSGKQIRSER
jgi:hypothetical protein